MSWFNKPWTRSRHPKKVFSKLWYYRRSKACLKITVRNVIKQYCISDRHRDVLFFLDKDSSDSLSEGLQILSEHPDRMVAEDIGEDEHRVNFRFYHLSQKDVEILTRLIRQIGIRSPSAVARNAVEVLIDKYELTQFKKPPGWRSRPLTLGVAGSRGKNPTPMHTDKPVRAKIIYLPVWLWEKLPETSNFSKFVRDAIDSCKPDTLTLSKELWYGDKQYSAATIYERHHERLAQLKFALPQFKFESQLLSAIVNQAVEKTSCNSQVAIKKSS